MFPYYEALRSEVNSIIGVVVSVIPIFCWWVTHDWSPYKQANEAKSPFSTQCHWQFYPSYTYTWHQYYIIVCFLEQCWPNHWFLSWNKPFVLQMFGSSSSEMTFSEARPLRLGKTVDIPFQEWHGSFQWQMFPILSPNIGERKGWAEVVLPVAIASQVAFVLALHLQTSSKKQRN